tara:strand:- start:28 stop:360 length:333 start_codon:yes stop_codon:yes gene_type:complete
MTKKILNILIIFSLMILNSCGLGSSIKSAVTGKTKPVGDEFLVEKKNPLVLPPNFDDLPEPKDGKSLADKEETSFEEDIKKILNENSTNDDIETQSSNSSLEDSILKKIK